MKDSRLFGKGRYKVWVLASIILLGIWFMCIGTVVLPRSDDLDSLSSNVDIHLIENDDIDAIDIEEREKLVRRMWGLYNNSPRIRLARFWQLAFGAAYEELTSDVPAVRDHAITEIAKMAVHSVPFDPPPIIQYSMRALELILKRPKEVEKRKIIKKRKEVEKGNEARPKEDEKQKIINKRKEARPKEVEKDKIIKKRKKVEKEKEAITSRDASLKTKVRYD